MFKSRPADALALLTPFYDQFATTVQHLPAIGRLNLIKADAIRVPRQMLD